MGVASSHDLVRVSLRSSGYHVILNILNETIVSLSTGALSSHFYVNNLLIFPITYYPKN